MRGLMLCALLASGALARPAGAQVLPDPSQGYVMVLEPVEWMGEGTRGIVRGRAVRVEGLAHHATGIRQVSINGVPAILRRDRSGATRFSGRLSAAQLEADVEIVAYPISGEPVGRIQRPDGTFTTGPMARLRPPVEPIAAAEVTSQLRVSLQALPDADRPAIAAALAELPGVVAAQPGTPAHFSLGTYADGYALLDRDGTVRHYLPAGSPEEGAASLPAVLSQELGALQLETVAPGGDGFPVELAFTAGQGRFRVGEQIGFRIGAGREGYLTVMDLGTDGAVTVLFPTEVDDARLVSGRPVFIPAGAEPFFVEEPTGRGAVRAFVTPRPLVLTTDAMGGVPAESVLRALREATTDPSTGRPLPWGAAVLAYRIVP